MKKARAAVIPVTLFDRRTLNITGAEDVISSDETGAVIRTSLGIMTVDGEQLRIVKLNADTGSGQMQNNVNSGELSSKDDYTLRAESDLDSCDKNNTVHPAVYCKVSLLYRTKAVYGSNYSAYTETRRARF